MDTPDPEVCCRKLGAQSVQAPDRAARHLTPAYIAGVIELAKAPSVARHAQDLSGWLLLGVPADGLTDESRALLQDALTSLAWAYADGELDEQGLRDGRRRALATAVGVRS